MVGEIDWGSCAYCGSHDAKIKEIKPWEDKPHIFEVLVYCNDCRQEDLLDIKGDYILWFLYRLLPDMQLRGCVPKRRHLNAIKPNNPDGAA